MKKKQWKSNYVNNSNYMKIISTNSDEFKNICNQNNNTSSFIFGNAPTLNMIDDEWVQNNKADTITIGLNRSYKHLYSDYLLFADRGMETELQRDNPKNIDKILKVSKTKNTQHLRDWGSTKKPPQNNPDGVILFRNSLISALDFCIKAKIKKVVLFGVQMDNRKYFYGVHPKRYDENRVYDTSKLYGYDTHTILKETLQFYFTKHMEIVRVGDSNFLDSINLKKIELSEVNKWIKRNVNLPLPEKPKIEEQKPWSKK